MALVLIAAVAACGLALASTRGVAHAQEGQIVAPAAGRAVASVVVVRGVAAHPDFRKWQLDLLSGGDPNQAHFLALGEKPVAQPRLLASFDSRGYPDGNYVLRLRVVRSDLNYDEYFSPLIVRNGGASTSALLAASMRAPELATSAESLAQAAASTPEPAPELGALAAAAETDAAPAASAPDASPLIRTDVPEGERWIAVDLSDQKLVAYQGDVAVLESSVSSGRPGLRTLPGTFNIYLKYEKAHMRGDDYDTPDVPWTMYYSGDFAIHGAYWHNDFGTPVSHGCVNLPVDVSKALYDWADIGTRVVVTN